MLNCYVFVYVTIGKLQLRSVMLQTMKIAYRCKWFELGTALCIPFEILENFSTKYDDNPRMALVRVYRYWLAEKNDLQPSWDKLITALQEIDEYSIAASVENKIKVSTLHV